MTAAELQDVGVTAEAAKVLKAALAARNPDAAGQSKARSSGARRTRSPKTSPHMEEKEQGSSQADVRRALPDFGKFVFHDAE